MEVKKKRGRPPKIKVEVPEGSVPPVMEVCCYYDMTGHTNLINNGFVFEAIYGKDGTTAFLINVPFGYNVANDKAQREALVEQLELLIHNLKQHDECKIPVEPLPTPTM